MCKPLTFCNFHLGELSFKEGFFRRTGVDAKPDLLGIFPHMADVHLLKSYTIICILHLSYILFIQFRFCDLPQNAAGIAYSDDIIRNILRDNTACTDDHIAANGNTGTYLYSRSDPYIITDCDGPGILQAFISAFGIDRMARGMKAAIRGNEYIISKFDLGSVQNY